MKMQGSPDTVLSLAGLCGFYGAARAKRVRGLLTVRECHVIPLTAAAARGQRPGDLQWSADYPPGAAVPLETKRNGAPERAAALAFPYRQRVGR